MLKIVNDSTIQVDEEVIETKDLILLAPRNKGANIGAFILYFGGSGMALGSILTDKESGQASVNAPLMIAGLGCVVAGIVDVTSRRPRYMNVWKVEVIE